VTLPPSLFIRHADGIVFDHVAVSTVAPDARPWLFTVDASVVKTNGCTDTGVAFSQPQAPSPTPAAGKN